MKVVVDSGEYKCWHEVGHATVCLHLGGDVEFIELLQGDANGHARTRCIVPPEIHRSVACGGFAAEFYLLKNGYAEKSPGDERNINWIVFHNAEIDRADFWGRMLTTALTFTEAEDREFMHHAIGADGDGGIVPLLDVYFWRMQKLVQELAAGGRVEGVRVKQVLQIDTSHRDQHRR